jgi:hypothetical protein
MRAILLAATLLAASGSGALAACIPHAPIGNLNVFQCDSDNQATDADDLKMFIDKATGVTFVDGSLDKNSAAPINQNIHITADAAFNQEGNGFAELHSANAGLQTNALHDVTFAPIVPSTVKDQGAFLGFDGFFGRGQVDAIGGAWDGAVTLEITFTGGTTLSIPFSGDTRNDDIGAIGFDEMDGTTSPFVSSVTMHLDSTGAWNEVKQFDFSVPGAVATIPETRTWAMMLLGFVFLGFAGRRARARLAHY